MANKPTTGIELRANNATILNYIRPFMPSTYLERVPVATQENMVEVANPILEYQGYKNDFLDALINRIGRVWISSKSYENPLRMFKKGMLEYGESVEEIFVNIAQAQQFDPAVAEEEVFKRQIPDVMAAFHRMNYQNFYKTTISNEQLRQAFLTEYGISDLITKIIESLYTGSEFDEFLIMKQTVLEAAKNGDMYPVLIPAATAANASEIVTTIKQYSNMLEFMSSTYNPMGVLTHSKKRDQILLINSSLDALIDVNVLAAAFNLSYAEFMGQRVLVDDFGATDILACLVDRDFFMVFDNNIGFTENYNGQGLYWNYFYHVWKTFSRSPFANAIVFTTTEPTVTVTSASMSPASIAGATGGTATGSAVVSSTGYAPTDVSWSINTSATVPEGITITADGVATIPAGTTAQAAQPMFKATSTFDSSKSANAQFTVT